MSLYRIEKDLLGQVKVPEDALFRSMLPVGCRRF